MKCTRLGYFQRVYFPTKMAEEVIREAKRLDRSRNWIVQMAWKIARKRILSFPSQAELLGEEAE